MTNTQWENSEPLFGAGSGGGAGAVPGSSFFGVRNSPRTLSPALCITSLVPLTTESAPAAKKKNEFWDEICTPPTNH